MAAGNLVSILPEIIGGLALFAGVGGYLRASYAKSLIEALRGEIDDKTRQLNEGKQREEHLKGENTACKNQIKALQEIVVGKKELDEIVDVLKVHEDRAKDIQRGVHGLLDLAGVDSDR